MSLKRLRCVPTETCIPLPTAHSEISEVTETCISSKLHLPDMGLQFLKQKLIY